MRIKIDLTIPQGLALLDTLDYAMQSEADRKMATHKQRRTCEEARAVLVKELQTAGSLVE
jgi:hypothetical protein